MRATAMRTDYRSDLADVVDRERPRWDRMKVRILAGRSSGRTRRSVAAYERRVRRRPRSVRDRPRVRMSWKDAQRELAYQAAIRRRFALAVSRSQRERQQ